MGGQILFGQFPNRNVFSYRGAATSFMRQCTAAAEGLIFMCANANYAQEAEIKKLLGPETNIAFSF